MSLLLPTQFELFSLLFISILTFTQNPWHIPFIDLFCFDRFPEQFERFFPFRLALKRIELSPFIFLDIYQIQFPRRGLSFPFISFFQTVHSETWIINLFAWRTPLQVDITRFFHSSWMATPPSTQSDASFNAKIFLRLTIATNACRRNSTPHILIHFAATGLYYWCHACM